MGGAWCPFNESPTMHRSPIPLAPASSWLTRRWVGCSPLLPRERTVNLKLCPRTGQRFRTGKRTTSSPCSWPCTPRRCGPVACRSSTGGACIARSWTRCACRRWRVATLRGSSLVVRRSRTDTLRSKIMDENDNIKSTVRNNVSYCTAQRYMFTIDSLGTFLEYIYTNCVFQ